MMNFFSLIISFGMALPGMSPEIQCTVLKVYSKKRMLGHKKFPQKYMAVSHNRVSSELRIGEKLYKKAKVKQLSKNWKKEAIRISVGDVDLRLEIYGKPISRKGALFFEGEKMADLTCH